MRKEYYVVIIIIVVAFALFIFSRQNTSATGLFVYPVEYREIQVKFYDESNKEDCIRLLDLVPGEYLEDLKLIKVLPKSSHSVGHYYESGVLELFGCDWDSINHELAHHMQMVSGDSSYNITHHLGRFNEFERQIFESMWEANNNSISFG